MSDSSTVDCDPDITVSSSFGSCSGGAKTSTLELVNNESSTVYVKVEYSIDGGTYQTKTANLSISNGATDTSQTHSVTDGQTIAWRITDDLTVMVILRIWWRKLNLLHPQLIVILKQTFCIIWLMCEWC